MVMMAPVRAGTERGAGDEQHPRNARQRGRQGGDDDGGIDRLEVHHHQQVHQHDGHGQADAQADEGGLHGLHLAAMTTWLPRGSRA
jgi:hypothetical protein